jgi:hypothetical protein
LAFVTSTWAAGVTIGGRLSTPVPLRPGRHAELIASRIDKPERSRGPSIGAPARTAGDDRERASGSRDHGQDGPLLGASLRRINRNTTTDPQAHRLRSGRDGHLTGPGAG